MLIAPLFLGFAKTRDDGDINASGEPRSERKRPHLDHSN